VSPGLKAVALMGATGTGKSALAMRLIGELDGATSIISCDSMQVYKHLDIGTAKPTLKERRRVRHHLIDCCELPEQFSAAAWARHAARIIAAENAAGRVPLIVGGTGLYLKALLEGLADIPDEDPQVREELLHLQRRRGTAYLHELLRRCDPAMAERLKPGDGQRILRALGVFRSSGRPLSEWQAAGRQPVGIDCPVYVLELDRSALRSRLADRFRAMLDRGWLEEVRWLDSLHLPDTHPAARAVGYRQLLRYVRGECPLDEAVEQGIVATRRYAKRQSTWFRHQTPAAVHGEADALLPLLCGALREVAYG